MTAQASRLTETDMRRLFSRLDAELRTVGIIGELYLVGGAVMCLALHARDATADVDALFEPSAAIRTAAARVAAAEGIDASWLNDAVKGFLSPRGDVDPFLELPNLRVFVARPEYLLAMKCAAMRLGADFHDLEDVRFLLRWLNISDVESALRIVTQYFDESHLLPKTRLVLQELLPH